MIRQVFLDSIDDAKTREVLRRLVDVLQLNPIVTGQWDLIEIEVSAAVTDAEKFHRLGFKPKDVLVLYSEPSSVSVTFKPDSFTNTRVVFTTNGAVKVRALVGLAKEE